MGRLQVLVCVLLGLFLLTLSAPSEDKAERKRPTKCKKPNKPIGAIMFKGCEKLTCTKINRKKIIWVSSFAPSKCCSFNHTSYRIGTEIQKLVLPDMCTTVSLMCLRKEALANLELVFEDDCPKRPGIMNVIMNSSETIKSPRYPSIYPPNVDECWMRTPSCGYGVQLEFTDFDVLGVDAHISLDPPVSGQSKFWGNDFNSVRAPPKVISFPADQPVKICFKSGAIVNGHKGFRAELTETVKTEWIASPNYPAINDDNYMEDPPNGYGAAIHQCWIRSPSLGRALELEFFQFNIRARPTDTGDWITIHPQPSTKPLPKYYGIDMAMAQAPPKSTLYQQDQLITVCLRTRTNVAYHHGFVAEAYEAMGPSTVEPSTHYDTSYYHYYEDYSSYPSSYYI